MQTFFCTCHILMIFTERTQYIEGHRCQFVKKSYTLINNIILYVYNMRMKSNSNNNKRPSQGGNRPMNKKPNASSRSNSNRELHKAPAHGVVPNPDPHSIPPKPNKIPSSPNRPPVRNDQRRPNNPNSGNRPSSGRKGKPKYRINVVGILTLLMIVLVLILAVVLIVKAVRKVAVGGDPKASVSETVESESVTTTPEPTQIDLDIFDGIYSQYAIIMDAEDGTILKGLNEDTPAAPASVTKMMTVIVGLENIEDLNATYTMPSSIYDTLYGTDLSTAGFENGETVKYLDLMYGTMMRSGAECCLGIADSVAGGEEAFVELMNAKAEELGMENTHFMNCTGEHDLEHYSTVHDMAILLRYGLQNDTFRTLIITSVYYSTSTDIHPDGLTFYSTFLQTLSSTDAGGAIIHGGKTGFTTEAGQCLASFCDVNGHEYILVTFGASLPAGTNLNGAHLHTDDAVLIYSRLYAYLTGGPTPTPRVAETVATTTTAAETDENGDIVETTTAAATSESTAATTTEATTNPDTTYITFG